MLPRTLLALALVSLAGACGKKPPPSTGGPDEARPAGGASSAPVASSTPRPAQSPTSFSGRVEQAIDVAEYTYLDLDATIGRVWVAVQRAPVAVGDRVTISDAVLMRNFHSKTLDRDFAEIWFARLGGAGGAPPSASAASPHGAASAHAPVAPVARAPGPTGHTVEEVLTKGHELAGKPVAVHGRVVKVNQGILGRNWIHLQDGTGSPTAKTDDLLVTSDASARPGDVLTATGPVAVDRDFGSGYRYGVMIEGATLAPDPAR
jgi:hypothetical protein